MKFKDIIARFRAPLFFIWIAIIAEKILWVVEPSFFGKVIDAVISHGKLVTFRTEHFFLLPLILWSAIFMGNTVIGLMRRIVSQKSFLHILSEVTEVNLKKSIVKDVETSRLVSQTNNTKEYITFLQVKIPEMIEHIVSIVGSLVALMSYDKRIGLSCLVMIVPLYLLDKISTPRVLLNQKEYHDKNQGLYDVIATRDLKVIRGHFDSLIAPQLDSTKWSAYNFGVLRVTLFVIFLVVLFISFDVDHFSTGTIYSIVSYLWTFISAIEMLPEVRETVTSLQDLDQRQ